MQCAGDIFAIKKMLFSSVDKNFNVVDPESISKVLNALEEYPVTKVDLEQTRIGKCINELRKKTSDESLKRRAKQLVKKWRQLIEAHATKNSVLSPSIHLRSQSLHKSAITHDHSNSCSPESDPCSSPQVTWVNKHENGLKQPEALCTCASLEEHRVKCELSNHVHYNKHSDTNNHAEISNMCFNGDARSLCELEPSCAQQTFGDPPKATSTANASPDDGCENNVAPGLSRPHMRTCSTSTANAVGVNGNFNRTGSFKEWNEVVEMGSNDDPLYVLPYTVID